MAKGELPPSQGSNSPARPTANAVSRGRIRRRPTTGQVLTWIGVVAGVIGTVAAIIQILPPPKDECGQSAFLGQAAYYKYSAKDFSNQPKVVSLYTSSGEPRDVSDVIIESSPELTALSQALQKQQLFAPGKMIFLYGAGGAGKSVVIDRLKSADHTVSIDVGQQFKYVVSTQKVHEKTELREELRIREQVISKMPALKDDVLTEGLDGLFKAGGVNESLSEAKNIIVDSLDELHPVSSARIIDAAMQYVSLHPDKNVLLAARGETFRAYFEKESYSNKNFKPIHLKPLYVADEPMLTWFVWQWLRFKHEANQTSGTPPSKDDATTLVQQLEELWKKYPDLRDFMVTLSPADVLVNHVKEKTDPIQLTHLIYSRTSERNRERHYRPSEIDGETWRVYNDALEHIARIAPLREDGSFLFPVQQTVRVKVGNQCVNVNAASVLNFSELVDLEPFNRDHLIYRFFPRPFHKYLAEKRSD